MKQPLIALTMSDPPRSYLEIPHKLPWLPTMIDNSVPNGTGLNGIFRTKNKVQCANAGHIGKKLSEPAKPGWHLRNAGANTASSGIKLPQPARKLQLVDGNLRNAGASQVTKTLTRAKSSS
ncbi:hypothetical protein HAX54_018315 [Datura stramonium]|uniref:Uncharacterized protein n=1 Tax=Datura stramonium TaxID=4076 RepID=A0ABS8UP48_DATST|nr:hypothetical protein [Datura stramonium]